MLISHSLFESPVTWRIVAGIVFASSGWWAAAAETQHTCALVVEPSPLLKDSPLVGLLEAGLLESGMTMVDRAMIDQALGEQELSASLGADDVAMRVQLGHVLKADVLVFVKAGVGMPERVRKAVVPFATLVVCDAARGVRTLVRNIPLDAKDRASAKDWVAKIVAAANVSAQDRELCAVPPFVSKDLAFDHEAMKVACAAVVEQAIADRTDLCGVELAEAQSLEREVRLSDGSEQKLARRLPLYLLGEYRNDGVGAARVVNITLTLRQGDRDRGSHTVQNLDPDEVGSALVELVDKLVSGRRPAAGTTLEPGKFDAAAEVTQLMQRAADFTKMGEWREAVTLYEACLLLDPGHKEARLKVVAAISQVPRPELLGATPDQNLEAMVQSHQLSRRGFAHQEQYCRRFVIGPKDHDVAHFGTANLMRGDHRDARAKEVFRETNRLNRDILLGLVESRIANGPQDSLLGFLAGQSLWHQLEGESIDDGFERLFKVVTLVKDHPEARELARRFCVQHYPTIGSGTAGEQRHAPPESWQPFIDRIAATENESLMAGVRKARDQRMANDGVNAVSAEYWKKKHAEAEAERLERAKPKQVEMDESTIVLERFEMRRSSPAARRRNKDAEIGGWLSIGKDVDVLWSLDALYVAKEAGLARCLCWLEGDRPFPMIQSVVYDGRYVWATAPRDDGHLIVIDPVSEQVWHVTATDGLLSMSQGVCLAPVGPGKICVVSSLEPPNTFGGASRGWCAIVSFDPSTGPDVNVFHEASDRLSNDPAMKVAPVSAGFSPTFCGVVGAPGPERRIIVGRRLPGVVGLMGNAYRGPVPPLVIDPEGKTVELLGAHSRLPGRSIEGWYGSAAEYQGDLYFSETGDRPRPDNWKAGLHRVSGPRAEVKQIGELPPINPRKVWPSTRAAVVFEDMIYMLGDSLWAVDPKTGAVSTIKYAFPDGTAGTEALAVSERYGLVTWRMEVQDGTLGAPATNPPPRAQVFYRIPVPSKQR